MKPTFQDYFFYTTSERRAVILFLCLVFILIGLKQYIAIENDQVPLTDNELAQLVKTIDSIRLASKQKAPNTFHYQEKENKVQELFPFNPNELEKDEWMKLGLSQKQAASILKYINSGGSFKKKEDLKKMYVVSEEQYQVWENYILLPDSIAFENVGKGKPFKETVYNSAIDINSADSLAWITVRGIGPVLAGRILKFRKRMGGFVSIQQLTEVYGIHDTLIQREQARFILDSTLVQKMPINHLTKEDLKNHPYIDWNLAGAIVNYRKQHGDFKSLDDLKGIVLVNDSIYAKLLPYIKIGK